MPPLFVWFKKYFIDIVDINLIYNKSYNYAS